MVVCPRLMNRFKRSYLGAMLRALHTYPGDCLLTAYQRTRTHPHARTSVPVTVDTGVGRRRDRGGRGRCQRRRRRDQSTMSKQCAAPTDAVEQLGHEHQLLLSLQAEPLHGRVRVERRRRQRRHGGGGARCRSCSGVVACGRQVTSGSPAGLGFHTNPTTHRPTWQTAPLAEQFPWLPPTSESTRSTPPHPSLTTHGAWPLGPWR